MVFADLKIGEIFLISGLRVNEPLVDSMSEKIEPISIKGLLYNAKTELRDGLLFCPAHLEVESFDE